MKYPFENTTVWDLIRHPFDEESGDPDGRTYMRLLSNIFFPIYQWDREFSNDRIWS